MTVICAWSPSAINAATWLRKELNVPEYQTIHKEFEQYFNCTIVDNGILENKWNGTELHFENEDAALMFTLRWV